MLTLPQFLLFLLVLVLLVILLVYFSSKKEEFPRGSHEDEREKLRSESLDKTGEIIASLFPPIGTPVYNITTTIFLPLHRKRREELLTDLDLRLRKLEKNSIISFKALAKNEEFNTIATKAVLLAQQNHQEEKIEALKAIVINSAKQLSDSKPMFDWNHRFLYLVDRFSPFHILLLKTFKYPEGVVEERAVNIEAYTSMSTEELFFLIYPEYRSRVKLIKQCWKELIDEGLVINKGFEQVIHEKGSLLKLTNDFGDKFLEMIESEE